jgi:glyoxylase-like metal-dependent hydrolase (beta-lactamase superfamily II)
MVSSKVTDRTFMIDTLGVGNPNTIAVYVVKGKTKTAVIDCGHASSYQTVLEGLRELGIAPSDVDYLIPTHVHLDHAGAAGHLLKHMTRAKVIAHERAVPHLVDPTRLIEGATSVFGERLIKVYGTPIPVDKERVAAVGEESHLEIGGVSLTTIHAPGHAPHQISVLAEEERLLFSADSVGAVFPGVPTLIPTTPPPSLEPEKLRQTIGRLSQTDPKLVLVPHYGVRGDVARIFEGTREKTDEWIEEVKKLNDQHVSPGGIADELRRRVISDAGMRAEDLPDYADLLVRTSTMGILHFLQRAKPDAESAKA